MSSVPEELEEFTRYAKRRLANVGAVESLESLFDAWREEHPSSDDTLAIMASLRDMEQGVAGRQFEEYVAERRQGQVNP